MTDGIEIDGRTYRDVPENWIENGYDGRSGSPRLYAVTVAYEEAAGLLRTRYGHPTEGSVLESRTRAHERDDGTIVPAAAESGGAWPRSLVPADGVEPSGHLRDAERDLLEDLWADRVDDLDPRVVADGGSAQSGSGTEQPQKARVGCVQCGVYAIIEITDKDEDPDAEVRFCPNCGERTDVLEVYR